MVSPRLKIPSQGAPLAVALARGCNRKLLWLLIAMISMSWNSLILWLSHQNLDTQVLAMLLWFGIVTVNEDRLTELWPRPSRASLVLGTLMLTLVFMRGNMMGNGADCYISYVLTPLLVLCLALLSRPINQLRFFGDSFFIAALLPISFLFKVPFIKDSLADLLSPLTAALSWIMLYACGWPYSLQGTRIVIHGYKGVNVMGSCSGIEQIVFSVAVIIIFLIAFPLREPVHKLLAIAGSILIPIAVNSLRIALLAGFDMMPGETGDRYFKFFHDSYGGLLFSMISVSISGWLYLRLIEKELAAA